MTKPDLQNNSNLQKMLDKILNDPFLDSSLDFYSHRLNIQEVEENKESKVEKPFSYVGSQGKYSSIEIQQKWQQHILSTGLSSHQYQLELPYRHELVLHFLSYQYDNKTHLMELTSSYNMFSGKEYSPALIKELMEKIAMVIRYQIVSIYNTNPFLLKNLFIFAHSQLWNYYLSLNENNNLNFNTINKDNSDLQVSLIKAYLEHTNTAKR